MMKEKRGARENLRWLLFKPLRVCGGNLPAPKKRSPNFGAVGNPHVSNTLSPRFPHYSLGEAFLEK
ncbi:MAG: hypothetical protein FWF79_00240 [Defluviitaleaceae bacterium]|nr:hypothetical protein [Defluviitaleaceae bacterium]